MNMNFGLMIEGLVSLLLLVTIGYCAILNYRLKRLRADEHSMRATIAELMTATEFAERAVQELKRAAHECEGTLGRRLKAAEECGAALDDKVLAGDAVLSRLSRVVTAGRLLDNLPPGTTNAKDVAAAARSFADRLRERVAALAA
jgi:hypothetical protein